MKWKKHGRNSRRRTYFEFWDYIDNNNDKLAFVRHDTRKGEFRVFSNTHEHHMLEAQFCGVGPFNTLTEAKEHTIAYFVKKKLEDYL